MSSDRVNERLSKLGVADDSAELEFLREENQKLQQEVKELKNELEIVRKNFDEALERVMESVRVIQQPQQWQHWTTPGVQIQPFGGGNSSDPPPNTWITYTSNSGEAPDNIPISRSGYLHVHNDNENHNDPQIYYCNADHNGSFHLRQDNSSQINVFRLSDINNNELPMVSQ